MQEQSSPEQANPLSPSPRQELEQFVSRYDSVPDAKTNPLEALQLSKDATWQQIEAKFIDLKELFKKQRLDILDDSEKTLSALYEQAQPLFSQVYQAYESLKNNKDFAELLFRGDTSVRDILESLRILQISSISYIYGESGVAISVAGVQRTMDLTLRLALTKPREDVNPEYVSMIPTDFGWRNLVQVETKELQEIVVELEDSENLVAIYGLLEKLLERGYRYLPRIDLMSEQQYLIDIYKELQIVIKQMEYQQKAKSRTRFLAAMNQSAHYRFSGRPRR